MEKPSNPVVLFTFTLGTNITLMRKAKTVCHATPIVRHAQRQAFARRALKVLSKEKLDAYPALQMNIFRQISAFHVPVNYLTVTSAP